MVVFSPASRLIMMMLVTELCECECDCTCRYIFGDHEDIQVFGPAVMLQRRNNRQHHDYGNM